jgi:hypothetical protein
LRQRAEAIRGRGRTGIALALVSLAFWLASSGVVSQESSRAVPGGAQASAYFQFDVPPAPDTFVFQTRDPAVIRQARQILAGAQPNRHIMGKIVKQAAPYNPPWSFHLSPDTVTLFDFAAEICDASIANVEANLDEACDSFLPGCEWCPWNSRLLAEITPSPPTTPSPTLTPFATPTPSPTLVPSPTPETLFSYLPSVMRTR